MEDHKSSTDRYGLRNRAKSRELDQQRSRSISNSLQSLCPTYIQEGQGAVITDVDGNRFIDLTGGWGCLAVGYSHPKVVEAVQEQAARFFHTDFTAIPYGPFVELGDRLARLAPGDFPKKTALFNSGAEAVENAIKVARAYSGKDGIVVFENAFHGRTLLTLGMTHKASPYKKGFGPFPPEVYRLPYPETYRGEEDYSDIEEKLTKAVDPTDVAAIVIEPIIGEGGFLVPPDGFLARLRELADKYEIVLIFDEIQSGMGRTGRYFAAEHFGVAPDLTTAAKSLAGGMPLSALIGRKEILDAPATGGIGGTYVGNPVACQSALAILDVIEEENLLQRATEIGEVIQERFRLLRERFSVVGDIRGIGAMKAIEFVKPGESIEPAPEITGEIVRTALRKGVILAKAGLHDNVIRILTPLVIGEDKLKIGLDLLEEAIEEVA